MRAEELRIGNYVQYPSKAVYAVDVLYKTYAMLENWQPIPLTEEWLRDFGFISKKKHPEIFNLTIKTGVWIKVKFYSDCYVCELICNSIIISSNVEYIHQLQNLYFALTGEELTLKISDLKSNFKCNVCGTTDKSKQIGTKDICTDCWEPRM